MRILPRPQKVERLAGECFIDEQSKVYAHPDFSKIARQFVDIVKNSSGIILEFTDSVENSQINFVQKPDCHAEGYVLNVASGGVTVSASTEQGCFYALQSLVQIFDLYQKQQKLCAMSYYMEDYPKFPFRSLHFDICRHFYGVETIKQIIDLMSEVKLNKLHLHLTDDQGWRVQIDKYPKLTEIGSVRGGSEVVRDGNRFVDETPHGGFLTKADVAELVAYAEERFVDIIPEIDIPGHMVAALSAYPEYSCTGKVLEVRKNWGISKDILCAGNEESYKFVCDVLDEICEMFPSEYVHLGGDEVPKERWCNCEKCVEKMTELKLDSFDQLQGYMLEFFTSYLEQIGKKVICWNDGLHEQNSIDIVSQVWKPFTLKRGKKQANSGRKVILSPFFNMYFDYPYAMTPLKKTLRFNPLAGIKRHARQNVLGVEGALWTEYVCDVNKLFFNLLPRLDALANCGWSGKLGYFGEAVKGRYAHYEQLGLTYNCRALGKGRNAKIVKKFFKTDADVELQKHREYLQKQSKKAQKGEKTK